MNGEILYQQLHVITNLLTCIVVLLGIILIVLIAKKS